MTLPHSDACFVAAYPAATTEAWLDGTTEPLFFSAAFPNRFFTTTTSVWCRASCRMARGNERGRSAGCSPITSSRPLRPSGKGNDKGNVEGVVGYARRNFMTPLPRFASWDAFNGHLEEQCRNRQGNVLRGHRESIGERLCVTAKR